MSSIDRAPHRLKREKTLAIPRHAIFFDTETNMVEEDDGSVSHSLRLGWVCYLRKAEPSRKELQVWQSFTDIETFWQFVLSYCRPKMKLWIIAHNINFDFTIMEGFKILRREGFKVKFFYASGLTTIISVRAPGKHLLFVDSLNWFAESLEKLGERIGFPKLSVDFATVKDSELSVYCHRDVEILVETFKSLVEFLLSHHVSRLCYTVGSTAMAAFLFRHYRQPIYIHNNKEAIELERNAYKGGRTECFSLGELTDGPYYILDVNSLYPFVMQNQPFPSRYSRILHHPTRETLVAALRASAVVAKVKVNTDQPVYAWRSERTMFPVGRFTVSLTTPELLYALRHNHLVGVESMVIYEQHRLFAGFVQRFYKLRQSFQRQSNPIYSHLCKLLMNSLYGKFGQKCQDWIKIGDAPDEPDRIESVIDPQSRRRHDIRYLLGEVFEQTETREAFNSFPAIAAHVTAYARLYLWELMQAAGEENLFYCDTDSLFVNQKGFDNLSPYLDNKRLGGLKIESVSDTLTINGLKDYDTAAKSARKGIRKTAVKLSETVYDQDQWPSLTGMLRRRQTGSYKVKRVRKILTRHYTKGVVDDKGRVLPFWLDDPFEPELELV